MNKKSQALVITLWVIIGLSVLAVNIGHRVSLALRLCSYQRDRLKALYIARAGVNLAISQIINDTTPNYDSLKDSWADNQKLFEKIAFNNGRDFASVSYSIIDNNEIKTIYGVIDEERKISINIASKELLEVLLEESKIESEVKDLVNNILIWRGDIPDTHKIYENLGYPAKSKNFQNIEELILVKGITPEDIEKLRKSVTVYTQGLININTVSPETLQIITRAIARKSPLSLESSFADSVAEKIITVRKEGYFKEKKDIKIAITGDEETNIFNELLNIIIFKSDNFFIASRGIAGKITKEVEAIYNRPEKNIKYWHET